MREINLVDHPFKRKMESRIGGDYREFGYEYFDSPRSLTGFRGYAQEGNGAEGRRDFPREARAIASIAGVRSVLDVGCAKGFLVRALRDLGIEAYGADVSEYAIGSAERTVRPFLRVVSAQEIDAGERYDLVHVSGVLVYMTYAEIRRVLRRFSEIARIGIIVNEPTREQITAWYDAEDVTGLDPLRKQELSRSEWDRLVTEAGFENHGAFFRKRSIVHDAQGEHVAACPPPLELRGG